MPVAFSNRKWMQGNCLMGGGNMADGGAGCGGVGGGGCDQVMGRKIVGM
jgi:hypothetical protein